MENILITGASGFIGGRLVERLRSEPSVRVLAGVRSWKGCARVARLGVELVKCDVTDESATRDAMRGISTVIHCAMSDHASIVSGTNNVLSAALQAKVVKVVCLSTADVYSPQTGAMTESSPQDLVGGWYANAKRLAELECNRYSEMGLNLSILRPGIVYGPFCFPWTQRIGLRLCGGHVSELTEKQNGTCNCVFVDDVVEACVALRRPSVGDGQCFNINGPDRVSWNDYLRNYAGALSAPALRTPREGKTSLKANMLQPARVAAKILLRKYEKQIMRLYMENEIANRLFRNIESAFRATPEKQELSIYARNSYFVDKLLRFTIPNLPQTSLSEGLSVSSKYMRTYGLV